VSATNMEKHLHNRGVSSLIRPVRSRRFGSVFPHRDTQQTGEDSVCADSRLVEDTTIGQTPQIQFELPTSVVDQKPVQPGDARDGDAAIQAFTSKVQPPKLPAWFWGAVERTADSELSKPVASQGRSESRLSALRGLATTYRLRSLKNRALRSDGILESKNDSARENQSGDAVPASAPVAATPAPAITAEPAGAKASQQNSVAASAKSRPWEFVPVKEHELSHIFKDRIRTLPAKPGQYT
jgi:hypothetical protein